MLGRPGTVGSLPMTTSFVGYTASRDTIHPAPLAFGLEAESRRVLNTGILVFCLFLYHPGRFLVCRQTGDYAFIRTAAITALTALCLSD